MTAAATVAMAEGTMGNGDAEDTSEKSVMDVQVTILPSEMRVEISLSEMGEVRGVSGSKIVECIVALPQGTAGANNGSLALLP